MNIYLGNNNIVSYLTKIFKFLLFLPIPVNNINSNNINLWITTFRFIGEVNMDTSYVLKQSSCCTPILIATSDNAAALRYIDELTSKRQSSSSPTSTSSATSTNNPSSAGGIGPSPHSSHGSGISVKRVIVGGANSAVDEKNVRRALTTCMVNGW